ncbi:riboflavin biosynthesis protein [Bacteroidia bacterium]|nr:riboflavin biosynthesis protein [Bacteroidia bacterium]
MKTIIIGANRAEWIDEETCATVGFFDGVHLGHQFLIEQLKKKARQSGLKTAVVTFAQHPRQVLQSDYRPQLLTSLDERLQQLAAAGVDYCYMFDFTPEFASTSAEDFIQKILREQLLIKELLIGYDHRFGKGRVDDFQNYVAYGIACGMTIHPVGAGYAGPDCEDESHSPISSTAIRTAIATGNMQAANKMLGYTYTLTGNVVEGDRLGNTIGFPTANLKPVEPLKILPQEGAYAVHVHLPDGRMNWGMAYIGQRPSIAKQDELRIEVHLFNFDEDLYGQVLQVKFVDYLRPSAKFPNLSELQQQLEKDVHEARNILAAVATASKL